LNSFLQISGVGAGPSIFLLVPAIRHTAVGKRGRKSRCVDKRGEASRSVQKTRYFE